MIAAILVCRCHLAVPAPVTPVLPASLAENRIVAETSGLEGERRVEPGPKVTGGIVIAEVAVVIARAQEKMFREHRQIDHNGWRVVVARPSIHPTSEIHRGKQNSATRD